MAAKNAQEPYSGPKRLIVLEDNDRITTILCRERSGKFIEQKSFSDRSGYKKYRQQLTASSEIVEKLKIEDPWSEEWSDRYNFSAWKNDSDLVSNVPKLLRQFASLCDDDQHCPRAQAPLLLLGAFLSGYTSEAFHDIDVILNGTSKARAVILTTPWTEGVSDFLREVTNCLSCNLFKHMKHETHLQWKPRKIISNAEDEDSLEALAYPQWEKEISEQEQLFDGAASTKKLVTGDCGIPLAYRNVSVLLEQWTGLPVKKTEEFLRSNPFCAAVVLRSSRAKIEVEGQLPLNPKELIWLDETFNGWQNMKYLMHGFLTAVFNGPHDKALQDLARQWKIAGLLIARYQAQKGISRLTAVQRRTWRMLVASLLAFLDYLRFRVRKLTKEEHAALREDWLWRLLPGCIAGGTVDRPPLAKRPVVVEQDYLEVFLTLVDRIWNADGGIHILRIPKDERLFELTDPDNPGIEIYGYYADIYLRSAGRSFYCLVFRKQTLLHLMRSFMAEVVSVPLDASRVLRYALKSKWAQDNVLRQADGYFKLHMPVDLQDKTVTYAVAIKIDRERRNELKDVVGVWEGSMNPDGTQSWKLSHTSAD